MPTETTTLARRYALIVALVYLLIRGIPDLILFSAGFLPEGWLVPLYEQHGNWLRYLFQVVPLRQSAVPAGFQDSLSSVMPLLLETALAFLLAAWFLRRKPWIAGSGPNSAGASSAKRRFAPWVVLVLVTLVWSVLLRWQVLDMIRQQQLESFFVLRESDRFLDGLPLLMQESYWQLSKAIYVCIPLGVLVPVWLHFIVASRCSGAQSTQSQAGMPPSLHRACVFAGFFLGFILVHTLLVQAVYMGLWPWAVEESNMRVPYDMLDSLAWPLTLSQVVFASLAAAIAAAVYLYGRPQRAGTAFRTFLLPVLTGISTYLLTSLVVLALVWIASYLQPGLISSLTRSLEYDPDGSLVLLIGANVLMLALLCGLSKGMAIAPRRLHGLAAVLLALLTVPAYVAWNLTTSNLGIAGASPGKAVSGTLGDARWRNMEQWCTGVVETHQATWLVGRIDRPGDTSDYIPDGTPDLSHLVYADTQDRHQPSRGLFRSRSDLTMLSRLQDDGSFKVEAVIPDVACLVVAPESEALFLFTGLDTPSSSALDRKQDAIFRSTDNGKTWEWLEAGFMPEVSQLGWGVKPVFASELEVWAWGAEPPSDDEPRSYWSQRDPSPVRHVADGTELRLTALHYSPDQGKTAKPVFSSEPLIAPTSYLHEISGAPTSAFSGRNDTERTRVVVQVSAERAYAWVSELMWYRVNEQSESRRLMLSSRATLVRTGPDGEWQVSEVVRQPDTRVAHASTSADGQTYAVLRTKDGECLARLDTETGEWVERQHLPSLLPSWLARNDMGARYFWSNGDYQVVSLWGYTLVPRLLLPFSKEASEILVDAHFFTRDGGRSWHQLAIPGYLGVMGLARHGSRLYWSQGNWYSNDEPAQYHYDLKQ